MGAEVLLKFGDAAGDLGEALAEMSRADGVRIPAEVVEGWTRDLVRVAAGVRGAVEAGAGRTAGRPERGRRR